MKAIKSFTLIGVLGLSTLALASDKFKSSSGASAGTPKIRSTLIQQHVDARQGTDSKISWPGFPRVWMERTATKSEASSTTLGYSMLFGGGPGLAPIKLPGLSGSIKRNVEFKYAVTTSMILMAKLPDGSPGDKTYVFSPDEDMFLENRPGSSLLFPKSSSQSPMIGLCYFEMTLNHDDLKQKGIDFIGSSYSSQEGQHEMAKVSRYSELFQIDRDIPVESYFYEECGNRFKKEVEKSVVKNFTLLIHQMINNTCVPGIQGNINPEGDNSCTLWINQFPMATKNSFVPRCERQKDESYRCVLKAKKGHRCPLFSNGKGQISGKFDMKNFNLKVAGGQGVVTPCDKANNQSCKMIKTPTTFFGVPFIKGLARCD